jgi:osmotically-inducible protein OsmY
MRCARAVLLPGIRRLGLLVVSFALAPGCKSHSPSVAFSPIALDETSMESARLDNRPTPPSKDSKLRAGLEARLLGAPDGVFDDVRFDIQRDVIVLRGRVATEAIRRRASETAKRMGAPAVVNLIRVSPPKTRAPGDAARFARPPADRAIEWAVEDALSLDPRVGALGAEVEVDNGAVTLSGEVPTREARRAADEDARDARGVVGVLNRIEVTRAEPGEANSRGGRGK